MGKVLKQILCCKRLSCCVIGLVAGDVWVQQWPVLPSTSMVLLMLIAVCAFGWRGFWPLAAIVFGMAWACLYGDWRLQQRMPLALQGQEVEVQGYLVSIPKQHDDHLSFDFIVTQAESGVPQKIRLSWYRPQVALAAGQGWQFTVKLKQPHGRLNPGGFDYEAWLFANGIAATGYVRDKAEFKLVDPGFYPQRTLATMRQALVERIDALLPGSEQAGVIKALTIGAQDDISQQQWQVFRVTGIIHLIVISGSHISLIAGWVFFMTRKFWARWGGLRYSPHNVAAVVAWLFALLYALIAGFSIPAQRAVVMLSVVMAALISQRNVTTWQVLLLALVAVVLFDPLAVMSVGFWLSFAAVGLLLYVSTGRMGRISFWREAIQAQWVTALGLAPLLILFFQQVSLIAPLANWLAVPLIGLLIVPLCLLALLLSFVSWPVAAALFKAIDLVLQAWYWLLLQMADWPLATLALPEPSWWALMFAGLGVLLLLAPKGIPGRYLGWFLLLPLLWPMPNKPAISEIRLSLLDVGQGLAAVVQTASHVLIFDTGARYSEQSDMGESVLLPYLHQQNIRSVDTLVVSHGDNDHSGGADSLLEQLPVNEIFSSVGEFADRQHGSYCHSGQNWRWDEVEFSMLAPGSEPQSSENDNSCVLKITAPKLSILLTGDIEQAAESALVAEYGERLASELLIAPHHGSKTSSSLRFLQQVKPSLILIPAGHLNRFGFPHPQIIERYRRLGIESLTTGESGAISVEGGDDFKLQRERQQRKRYWMEDGAG
jgi:competence protein ComEC